LALGEGGGSRERVAVLGINVVSERKDAGADRVLRYLSGSRDQVVGTVDKYGLLAKRQAYVHVKSIIEFRSPTT